MNDLNVFIQVLLQLFGGIAVIGGGIAVITKWLSPYKTIKEKLEKHEVLLDNDNKRLLETEKSNKMQCKCMLALLDHEITGNSIEKLRKTRKELQDFLIEK